MIATIAATTLNTTIIYFEGVYTPSESESVSHSVVSDSLPSYGLYAQKHTAYIINL